MFFAVAYCQLQILGFYIYLGGIKAEDIVPWLLGASPVEDDPLAERPQELAMVEVSLPQLSFRQIFIFLVLARILLSFYIGLNLRYQEDHWHKKVFMDKKEGVLAAIFTEKQMHQISNYDLRKKVYVGDIGERPFSKLSHALFALSLVSHYILESQT